MKNSRIAIRPLPTLECIVSLAPTIAALKQKNPGATIGLVAEEKFREASHLLGDLDFFASEGEEIEFDQCFDLRGQGTMEGAGESQEWKTYLQTADSLELGNPFHQIDLLRKAAQVDTIDVNFELAPQDNYSELPDSLRNSDGLRMAVSASSLSEKEIEAVLEGLSRHATPVEIFLIGSVSESRTTSQFLRKWDGKLSLHDLCGRLGVSGTATLLRACDIHVGGPGLHSILSSGFGTFTICIDENPARGSYLYPYGHGHLVVQRGSRNAAAENLAAVIHSILDYTVSANNGSVPTLQQWQEFADSMISEYLTKIRLVATQRVEVVFKDADSLTELYQRPLLFAGSELYDVMQIFYRLMWEHSLNGRNIVTHDLEVLHQDTMPLLCDILKPIEQLYELANFGRVYSSQVKDHLAKGDLAKAKQDSERLQEVEELLASLASTQPFFAPLSAFHRQRQANMDAENPLTLSDEMASLFQNLQNRSLVLLDLARSLFHTVFESESATNPLEEGKSNG